MSVYITGGSLGFALGPLLFAPFAQRFGIQWTPLLAIPGLLVIAFFLMRVPPIPHHASSRGGFRALRPYAKPLTLLYTIVVLRTLTSLGFATFVPVMLTRRGMSVAQAGATISLYLFFSGVGGFSGGPLADRHGPRKVIALSLVAACPFLVVAPLLTGWPFIVVLAIGGLFLQSTLPVNVTFGQSLAPVSAATVSSLMMGFAWGTGGLSVPLVGLIADRIGIEHTLVGLALIPLLAAACALPLPKRAHLHSAGRSAVCRARDPRLSRKSLWYDSFFRRLRNVSLRSPIRVLLLVRSRADHAGRQVADLGERRRVCRLQHLSDPDSVLRADPRSCHREGVAVAAGHLHVPARRHLPHPVQHADPLDVRGRAGADVGNEVLSAVLRDHRCRRRHHHDPGGAAPVPCDGA